MMKVVEKNKDTATQGKPNGTIKFYFKGEFDLTFLSHKKKEKNSGIKYIWLFYAL